MVKGYLNVVEGVELSRLGLLLSLGWDSKPPIQKAAAAVFALRSLRDDRHIHL